MMGTRRTIAFIISVIGFAVPGMNGQSTAAPELTRGALETWLDEYMTREQAEKKTAGAVVVVVKNGEVLLEKGYGFADLARHIPVDSERTLFRAGSVSKLFTWTAVMQQVEQGKIDLDADINTYLDFKIPPRQGAPVALHNLMTHGAGFDEVGGLLLIYDPRELHPLREELKRWMPPRVTAPGSIPAYSNYGADLAGYIVQRVSGEPFEAYIERHIFAPLGMKFATFRQPLPDGLASWMSKGYSLASGDPKPFEIDTTQPDGALSASGGDIGRFMIAHLQNGAFGASRLLEEATAVRMHTTAWGFLPPLNRMLLGFYENNVNGHRVITHGGDLQWFHSELNLFIDDGVGIFVSLNSLGKDGAAEQIRTGFFREFSDRYFPAPLPEGSVDPETSAAHAHLITGRYISSRRSDELFPAALNLLGQTRVLATENGSISVADVKGLNGEPKKWREIAPLVWRSIEGPDRIAAKIENDRVVCIGYDELPFMPFQPVPWWSSAAWLLPLLIIGVLALVGNTLAWPATALVRRHYGVRSDPTSPEARAHRLVRIASLLATLMVIAWVVLIQILSGDLGWIGPHMNPWISSLRLFTSVIVFATSAIALWNVWAVLRSRRKWLAKIWSVLLAIPFVALFYFVGGFHFLGYSAKY